MHGIQRIISHYRDDITQDAICHGIKEAPGHDLHSTVLWFFLIVLRAWEAYTQSRESTTDDTDPIIER